jgi:hypothetical protein
MALIILCSYTLQKKLNQAFNWETDCTNLQYTTVGTQGLTVTGDCKNNLGVTLSKQLTIEGKCLQFDLPNKFYCKRNGSLGTACSKPEWAGSDDAKKVSVRCGGRNFFLKVKEIVKFNKAKGELFCCSSF